MNSVEQTYQFLWNDMADNKMEVTITYVGQEITKVYLEGEDISNILDNDYLSELLYDALYEYEQEQRSNW